jgi:hypothetical protein
MNRMHLALCLMLFLATPAFAQESEESPSRNLRPASFGFGVLFNDFITARNIRNATIESAINNKQIAKLRNMNAGISAVYAQGLLPKLDFAATLGFSSGSVVLRNKSDQIKNLAFLSADASVQAKMLPENFRLIPYLSAGIGASVSDGYYGAMLPLGVGLRFRISDEFSLGLQSQYRVAVTETSGYHLSHGLTVLGKL